MQVSSWEELHRRNSQQDARGRAPRTSPAAVLLSCSSTASGIRAEEHRPRPGGVKVPVSSYRCLENIFTPLAHTSCTCRAPKDEPKVSLEYPELFYIPVALLYPGFFPQPLSLGGISGLVAPASSRIWGRHCVGLSPEETPKSPLHRHPQEYLLKEKKNMLFTPETFLCFLEQPDHFVLSQKSE